MDARSKSPETNRMKGWRRMSESIPHVWGRAPDFVTRILKSSVCRVGPLTRLTLLTCLVAQSRRLPTQLRVLITLLTTRATAGSHPVVVTSMAWA